MSNDIHQPVLLDEVLSALKPSAGAHFIDATANGGGHLLAIRDRVGVSGAVLGIEWDPDIFEHLKTKIGSNNNLILVNESYIDLKELIRDFFPYQVDGILFDFGISSWHVDGSERGFTFMKDQILDMRFNTLTNEKTAAFIVNSYNKDELELIFKEYGEERYARQIAEAIFQARKKQRIETTQDLLNIIKPFAQRGGRGNHFGTRIFQALRIEVNDELKNIRLGVTSAVDCVRSGGVVAAISFHSLEDRIVKNIFRESYKSGQASSISKKPIVPSRDEILANRRSRSAKLRFLIKA